MNSTSQSVDRKVFASEFRFASKFRFENTVHRKNGEFHIYN